MVKGFTLFYCDYETSYFNLIIII